MTAQKWLKDGLLSTIGLALTSSRRGAPRPAVSLPISVTATPFANACWSKVLRLPGGTAATAPGRQRRFVEEVAERGAHVAKRGEPSIAVLGQRTEDEPFETRIDVGHARRGWGRWFVLLAPEDFARVVGRYAALLLPLHKSLEFLLMSSAASLMAAVCISASLASKFENATTSISPHIARVEST